MSEGPALSKVEGLDWSSFSTNSGILTAGDISTLGWERIGVKNGSSGTFTQNGGINTTTGLTLGAVSGSSGTYNFFGGTLNDDLIVGDAGTGVFNNSAGTHNVTGSLTLGNQATGDGTYNLSGTGSVLVSGDTVVGNYGTGTFNQSGGTNSTTGLYLGNEWGSKGTYNLSGGDLTTSWAYVGQWDVGVFNQSGGTHTTTGSLLLGNGGSSWINSDGTYNLSGTGILIAIGETVGGFGKGTFNQFGGTNTVSNDLVVADGPETSGGTPTRGGDYNLSAGDLSVVGKTIVGNGNSSFKGEPGGKGTFTQTGGTHTTDALILGGAGSIGNGTGTYNLSGGMLNANTVVNNNNSVFDFQGGIAKITSGFDNYGTFKGSGGTFNGDIANYGTVSPGSSPGTIAINGNYTQGSGGLLYMELAGYLQGTEYDLLSITGTATLDGTLSVSLLDSFLPGFGSSFSILEAGNGVFGTFRNLNLPSLGGGLGWQVAYNPNNVSLTVTPEPLAMTLFLLGGAPIAVNLYRKRRVLKV